MSYFVEIGIHSVKMLLLKKVLVDPTLVLELAMVIHQIGKICQRNPKRTLFRTF